jgi:hypothetical protein
MRRRPALTNCGNVIVKDNVTILPSGLKRITFNSIVKVYRVKEWVNARHEKLRESTDVGLDSWFKLHICLELWVSERKDWMSYGVRGNHTTTYTLLLYIKTSMNVYKSSKTQTVFGSGRR